MGQAALALNAPANHRSAVDRFFDYLPTNPWCGTDKPAFLIRHKSIAIKYDYIQFCAPHIVAWIVFDLDHDNAWIWHDQNLPAPNFIVRNRTTGRGHLYYAIKHVATHHNARSHPQRYLKAVRKALAAKLKADRDYVGRIAKNPLSPTWDTTILHNDEYELGELADSVNLGEEPIWQLNTDCLAAGRNCLVFDRTRFYAYRHVAAARRDGRYVQWEATLYDLAQGYNNFAGTHLAKRGKLGDNEIKHIAKSVAKYTWHKCNTTKGIMELPTHLPLESRQRLSARRTHKLRTDETEQKINAAIKLLEESKSKVTKTAVAKLTGLSRQHISNRYGHLFSAQEQPVNQAQSVNYGVYQITAPYMGAFVDALAGDAQMNETENKNNNHHILTANSRSGGEAAKQNSFALLCKTLHAMEKVAQSDGVSLRQFNFETRGRLAKLILAQRLPWDTSQQLAINIVTYSAGGHKHMNIDDWCAYIVAVGKAYRLGPKIDKTKKIAEFERFLRGERCHITDADLKDLAEYLLSVL